MRRRITLLRRVTFALLLLAGFDLGVPGLCNAERIASATAAHLSVGMPHSDFVPDGLESPWWQDDCFCCCSHLLTSPVVRLAGDSPAPAPVAATSSDPARLGAAGLFRPPRA